MYMSRVHVIGGPIPGIGFSETLLDRAYLVEVPCLTGAVPFRSSNHRLVTHVTRVIASAGGLKESKYIAVYYRNLHSEMYSYLFQPCHAVFVASASYH